MGCTQLDSLMGSVVAETKANFVAEIDRHDKKCVASTLAKSASACRRPWIHASEIDGRCLAGNADGELAGDGACSICNARQHTSRSIQSKLVKIEGLGTPLMQADTSSLRRCRFDVPIGMPEILSQLRVPSTDSTDAPSDFRVQGRTGISIGCNSSLLHATAKASSSPSSTKPPNNAGGRRFQAGFATMAPGGPCAPFVSS